MPTTLCHIAASAFTVLVASLVLFPTTLNAQVPQVERIDIFDAGIYCAETTDKIRASDDPTGYRGVISSFKLQKRTTKIPVQVGLSFGMRYSIVGTPNDAIVPIRVVTRIPPPGVRNPETGMTFLVSDYIVSVRVGATPYREYHIEYDWEGIPGVWVFEYWYKDRKLAEQRFTLSRMTPAQKRNSGGASCSPLVSSLMVPMTGRSD